jgi:hypothetical protein
MLACHSPRLCAAARKMSGFGFPRPGLISGESAVRIHVGGKRSKISGRWDWFDIGISKLSSALARETSRVERAESTHSLERKVNIVRARREGYRYPSVILRYRSASCFPAL